MRPQVLFWLLGGALMLSSTTALVCLKGYLIHIADRSEFPIAWTVKLNETCQAGEKCQETLILVESGDQITAITSQGCTSAQAHESKDVQHRAPPGVTIASFTKVCQSDLCNNLDNTVPLWTMEPTYPPAPGGLQCPACMSLRSCPGRTYMVTCPAGTARCYQGNIRLVGGDLSHSLQVRGCVPQEAAQEGCQLLNGTRTIGPIALKESCQASGALTCYQSVFLYFGQNLREEPQNLETDSDVTCEAGEVCHETVLLIESGPNGIMLGSKGCIRPDSASSRSTKIGPPGITITSYTRLCNSNMCNNISSTASILKPSPPAEPAPGHLLCPTCVTLGSFCFTDPLFTCPKGTSRCYYGRLQLNGGGISSGLTIRGCAPPNPRDCKLLGETQAFGPINVSEFCGEPSGNQLFFNRVSATTAPAWGVGVGFLLVLWGDLP
ncbi:CD177 antigen [Sarcophilus harrisii]|uniref:CD177 molecule n=1 Tax=Sarcophilus harrisii TaxID=9305 RepID=G3VSL7_SARHA|nr:CD177 antigen [Sarcophilus harrisii]